MLFKKPTATVASVATTFSKMIDELKDVEQANEQAAADATVQIEQAKAAREAALEEVAAARAVAFKISAIIDAGNVNATLDDLRTEAA